MQHLTLPEPANILFTTVYEELAKTLPSVLPENGRWRLDGGTVLAARWLTPRRFCTILTDRR